MATAHVQDPAVTERRLRPIFDWLEVGNNKKALQEADKFLKKHPDVQCARALKALALVRLGRDAEADPLIDKLASESPSDDQTLQVVTYCYKEQEEWEKICALYTSAAKKSPGNEEILAHLFMAHVRVGDFHGQQTVAMQLYKLKPKNPYYFWATMSLVLKALRGPDSKDPTKSNLMLALAHRMIEKLIAEKKLDAEQEVQLYLSVLNYQAKHTEALEFLDSDLGRSLYPGAPVTLRIDLLKQLQRWPELDQMLRNLLRDNRERWDYYQEYIANVLQLHNMPDQPAGTAKPFNVCLVFLDEMLVTDSGPIRGPYLGRLLMHKTMTDAKLNAQELLGDIFKLLVDYFELFGVKACCTNDIQLFLGCLDRNQRNDLSRQLLVASEITSTTLPKNKEQMQRHICALQISRICGSHDLSTDHLSALYTALSLHYEHGVTAFGMDLLPTDMGPSDAYALLSAHVMYDVACKLRSSEPLVEALCLLHYLLANSRSNFHAKLLCLKIYHLLGCGWAANETYQLLDVKHVQLDSMGYLHCAQLPICGIPSTAKPLYDATLKFFTASYRDSLDYLAMCYKFGSFSKLQEFMDFRDRLSNSLHYALVSAETLLAEMVCMSGTVAQNKMAVNSFNLEPHKDRLDWTEMTDNRDLSVIVRWNQNSFDENGQESAERVAEKMSFQQDLELLKIRSFMLRIIGACIAVYDQDQDRDASVAVLNELQPRWTELLANIQRLAFEPVSNQFLCSLLPSRIFGILALPYNSFFDNLIKFCLAIESGTNTGQPEAASLESTLTEIERVFVESIRSHNANGDLLWSRREAQEKVTNCLEMLALCTLVLTAAQEKYATLTSIKVNRKSKHRQSEQPAEDTVSDRDRLQAISSIVVGLKDKLQTCDEALVNWTQPICPVDITERMTALSLNQNFETNVETNIKKSHSVVVRELRSIIKEKMRQLRTTRD